MKILVLNHAPFQSPDAKFYTIQIHSVHGEPNGSLVKNIAFGFFLMEEEEDSLNTNPLLVSTLFTPRIATIIITVIATITATIITTTTVTAHVAETITLTIPTSNLLPLPPPGHPPLLLSL